MSDRCVLLLSLLVLALASLESVIAADLRCGPCDPAQPNGRYCERLVDFCGPVSCANGGTCINHYSGFECKCPPTHWGVTCANAYVEPYLANDLAPVTYAADLPALTVTAQGGEPPLQYQWYMDGWALADSTPTLTLDAGDLQMTEPYTQVWAEVYDARFNYVDTTRTSLNPYCSSPGVCYCLPECVANATCLEGNVCRCPAGFEGPMCDREINECASSPCVNGATCINLLAAFACTCPAGFTGARCEVNIDECAIVPCQNNATCVDRVNAFQCTCLSGFDGPYCEINLDDCASKPCKQASACIDGAASYTCVCLAGYCGKNCDTRCSAPDDCVSSPCMNGGTCTDGINQYTCTCAAAYTGLRCELEVDECATLRPCRNNAVCVDGVGNYTCICGTGYCGQHCDIRCSSTADLCISAPCLNGATCTNFYDYYRCTCAPGYTGTRCEVEVNECSKRPCKNGATCIDGIASYQCLCRPGYCGLVCNTRC